jgi:hypothetical protein
MPIFEQHPWGYSLRALLGGIHNIHPYYIDELFRTHNYTTEEICNIAATIKEKCPISFSSEKLKMILNERFYIPTVTQAKETIRSIEKELKIIPAKDTFHLKILRIKDIHKGKKFLVIANGPSILKYENPIKKLIKGQDFVTIGCNFLNGVYEPDYHIFVSKKRFLKYVPSVSAGSILIVPNFFGRRLIKENYNGRVERIQVVLGNDPNVVPIQGISQHLLHLNVAANAILTAYQMGAQEIMAVGMDGYESRDPGKVIYFYNEEDSPDNKITASLRYENLTVELKRVVDFLHEQGISFSIVTPTSHKRYYKNMLTDKYAEASCEQA